MFQGARKHGGSVRASWVRGSAEVIGTEVSLTACGEVVIVVVVACRLSRQIENGDTPPQVTRHAFELGKGVEDVKLRQTIYSSSNINAQTYFLASIFFFHCDLLWDDLLVPVGLYAHRFM